MKEEKYLKLSGVQAYVLSYSLSNYIWKIVVS